MTNSKQPIFELDLKWSGTDSVPAFHEVLTYSYPEDQKVLYSDLVSSCRELVELACSRAVEAERIRELDRQNLERAATESGLDIQKMLEFYGTESTAGLLVEMQKHIKQLIDQHVDPVSHHPVTPPRAG